MYYYFSADYPAVIKIGGIYLGTITNTVKFCNLNEERPPLIEIIPTGAPALPCAFFPNAEFLAAPPPSYAVTDLGGGYLIKAFSPIDVGRAFSLVAQEKYQGLVATVFTENGYKLSLETPSDCYAEPLPFPVAEAKFSLKYCGSEELLFAEFLPSAGQSGENTPKSAEKIVCAFSAAGKIKKVFEREVAEISLDKEIETTERYKDIAKHVVKIFWEYDAKKREMKESSRSVFHSPSFDKKRLPTRILPFAFIEEFLVKGDYLEYLTGSVKENADKLGGFFGEFIGVMPPPRFRKENETGLIYRTGERTYKAEYYIFELSERKIDNIITLQGLQK